MFFLVHPMKGSRANHSRLLTEWGVSYEHEKIEGSEIYEGKKDI